MFGGRALCIATMHDKEKVIAPLLGKSLGVRCFTCNIDTDQFGMFSGELKRKGTALETARLKCLEAMRITGCDLAVSSEGSFGPHPAIGFIPCNEELLLLMDAANKLEISATELSITTNYASDTFTAFDKLKAFAEQCAFPSHGLIIKSEDGQVISKGITEWQQLKRAFKIAKEKGSEVIAETDMRAHLNPTRMQVIQNCTEKLISALCSLCPECNSPGFSAARAVAGLPCERCMIPTRSTLKYIMSCPKCSYRSELYYPHEKKQEDPMYCDVCNP